MDKRKMNLQLFADGMTKMANMVNPEVLADMISAGLKDAIRFAPLARIDRTLVGRPGDTVTVPRFKYIGDANDVAEGQPIDVTMLETDTDKFTIKKAGKGVEITDEAVLSGYGDPIGEAGRQLLLSIANKVDNDVLEALKTAKLHFEGQAWDIDTVSDAMDLFNDEDDTDKVLLMNPKDASKLRKAVAGDWDKASDLGDAIIVRGTYGGVLGAQVVRSRKIAEGEAYLVKVDNEEDVPEEERDAALAIYMKRKADVEDDRDIIKKTTVMTGDQHYGAHLYNEGKVVKITIGAGV